MNKRDLKKKAKEIKKAEQKKRHRVMKYAEKKLRKEVEKIFYWQSGKKIDFSKHELKMIKPNRFELNSCSPTVIADILEDEFGNIRTLIVEPEDKNNKKENLLNELARNLEHYSKKQIKGYIERKMLEIHNAKRHTRLYEYLKYSNLQDFTIRFKHNFTEEDVFKVLNS